MPDGAKEAITVVVPVKDRATLVLRTLDSIRRQTYRPLKLVVVDNGSTDGTPQSVASWIEKNEGEDFEAVLVEEAAPGPSAARNSGLQEVDTRLMMHFDSDDVMQPGHVESVMKRFSADDMPDLVVFRVRYHPINGEDRVTHKARGSMMPTHIFHSLIRTQGYAAETALVRRAGGWNNSLRCWEDLELGSRVLLEARRRVMIDDINVDVYARADSVTGTEFSSKHGDWEKALDRMESNFEKSLHKDRDKWRRLIAYRRAILAAAYKREGNAGYASELLRKALGHPLLNGFQRAFLNAAYLYTVLGGRGAAVFANIIL